MYLKISRVYFILTLIQWRCTAFCPSDLIVEGSYSRLSPIDVESSKTAIANTTSPVTSFNGVFNFSTLKNTGSAVEVYPNEKTDKNFVTGGVLCNKTYEFYKGRFYISQDLNTCSSNTIDGKGTPLEFDAIYYNSEYESFENALKYADGVAIITFPINVGPFPNMFFTPFQYVLSSGVIKQPNSEFKLLNSLVYIWFDVNFFITEYFAYPGSYLSLPDGRQYPSAIYIVTPPRAFISYNQFAAFKNVLGFDGESIITKGLIFPSTGRPVYKGFGFQQRFQFY